MLAGALKRIQGDGVSPGTPDRPPARPRVRRTPPDDTYHIKSGSRLEPAGAARSDPACQPLARQRVKAVRAAVLPHQ